MGQKVSPHGLRVGVITDWDSRWYAGKKNFGDFLVEDFNIRKYIKKRLYTAGVSKIYIDRTADGKINLNIFTARPGMVVGKGGENIKVLREEVEKMTGKPVQLDISEVEDVDIDAQLVAENVASSLEKRISFRRAMKQVIGRAQKTNKIKGIKIQTSGRLGGAEIARAEGYSEGMVPLSTLRANIDYGFAEADTTYGKLGVKVWINKGEVLPTAGEGKVLLRKEARRAGDKRQQRGRRPEGRGPKKPRNN